jgi:hypothetical protein
VPTLLGWLMAEDHFHEVTGLRHRLPIAMIINGSTIITTLLTLIVGIALIALSVFAGIHHYWPLLIVSGVVTLVWLLYVLLLAAISISTFSHNDIRNSLYRAHWDSALRRRELPDWIDRDPPSWPGDIDESRWSSWPEDSDEPPWSSWPGENDQPRRSEGIDAARGSARRYSAKKRAWRHLPYDRSIVEEARRLESVFEMVRRSDTRFTRTGLEQVNDRLQRLYGELGPPTGGES